MRHRGYLIFRNDFQSEKFPEYNLLFCKNSNEPAKVFNAESVEDCKRQIDELVGE